jgi:hypothetical protein
MEFMEAAMATKRKGGKRGIKRDGTKSDKAEKSLPPRPEFGAGAYTIREFCAAHRLSEAMYFKLKTQNLGPREMVMGSRKAISIEAAEAWRKEREAATASTADTGITTIT